MKNIVQADAQKGLKTVVDTTVVTGDPVLGWGTVPGLAQQNADTTTGVCVIQRNCTAELSVKGEDDGGDTALAAGTLLYLSADSAVLNFDAVAGTLYGVLLEAVASGVTATVEVLVN